MTKSRHKQSARRRAKPLSLGVEITPDMLGPEPRTARLNLRLAPTERRQMQEVADALNTTTTNVITHLVAQAWEILHRKKGG